MTLEQKKLLQPFAVLLEGMANEAFNADADAARAMLTACYAASQTNCAWSVFHAAQFMAPLLRERLARLEAAPKAKP